MSSSGAISPRGENRRRFLKASGGLAAVTGAAVLGARPAAAQQAPAGFGANVKDFGAVGDGRTDDSAAIQAAIDGVDGNPGAPKGGITGGWLWVPAGEYLISETITLHRFAGVLQGSGVGNLPTYGAPDSAGGASGFRWAGEGGKPMFRVTDSAHVAFRNLMFIGNDAAVPSAGIDFHSLPGAGAGTNAHLVVEDCLFGPYTWTEQGVKIGLLDAGVTFTGHNANNDQFSFQNCSFLSTGAEDRPDSVGVRIDGTQSIWGSMLNCFFNRQGTGIRTASAVLLINPQFNSCATDLQVAKTAHVQVIGFQSESSRQMAKVSNAGKLHVDGGRVQVGPTRMPARSGALIDAFPSGSGQSIVLRNVEFTQAPTGDVPRPTIAFGPDEATGNACNGGPFYVKVEDCTGIYKAQAEFAGTMWASVPPSRGAVEWTSRHPGGADHFRNELRPDAGDGYRETLNREVWDAPVTDS